MTSQVQHTCQEEFKIKIPIIKISRAKNFLRFLTIVFIFIPLLLLSETQYVNLAGFLSAVLIIFFYIQIWYIKRYRETGFLFFLKNGDILIATNIFTSIKSHNLKTIWFSDNGYKDQDYKIIFPFFSIGRSEGIGEIEFQTINSRYKFNVLLHQNEIKQIFIILNEYRKTGINVL